MATSVVEPMEEALSGIAGIDEMSAQRIAEGRAQITVRFVLERDLNDAANDVREKVAGAMRSVPPEAAAAGHHQGRSRRRSGHVARASRPKTMSLRTLTEIADKQVKRAHRDGRRRRRR